AGSSGSGVAALASATPVSSARSSVGATNVATCAARASATGINVSGGGAGATDGGGGAGEAAGAGAGACAQATAIVAAAHSRKNVRRGELNLDIGGEY